MQNTHTHKRELPAASGTATSFIGDLSRYFPFAGRFVRAATFFLKKAKGFFCPDGRTATATDRASNKREGAGGRFGDYLYVDCANLPSAGNAINLHTQNSPDLTPKLTSLVTY